MSKLKFPALTGLLEAATFVALSGTVVTYLLGRVWPFELFTHFRLQNVVLLLVIGLLMIFLRRRLLSVASLAGAALLALPLHPYYTTGSESAPAGAFKVISFNVHTSNPKIAEVRDYLLREDADFVFLLEINEEWTEKLSALKDRYPHQVIYERSDNFGIAVYSKHPFSEEEVLLLGDDGLPATAVQVKFHGATYDLLCAHPVPPSDPVLFEERNAALKFLAERAKATATPNVLLLGDFNLSPFSPYFGDLVQASGLRDSALGYGLRPTWMSGIPPIAIPIDHILISENLAVTERKIGPSLGSDHNAIILSVAPRR